MKKTLAMAGSNSSTSINQRLINIAAQLDDSIDVIDLRQYDAPMFSKDIQDDVPASIVKLYDLIQEYENIIISTPAYNGLPTSFFKNIFDWLTRRKEGDTEFMKGKKLLLFSASPGKLGGATALENLKSGIVYTGAETVAVFSLGSFHKRVNDDDELVSDIDREALQEVLNKLHD
jgi:NAD(P)H-dependent FMN reductase